MKTLTVGKVNLIRHSVKIATYLAIYSHKSFSTILYKD